MGIDGLAQILALAFFLAGFAGVAIVVTALSQGRSARRGALLTGVGIVGGLIFLVVSQGLVVVGATERLVVFNTISGDLENPRGPGIHIIIPGLQQTTTYPVNQQTYTMSDSTNEGNLVGADAIRARSIDGQEVRVDITVIFNVDAQQVNTLHINWSATRDGYVDGFVRPTVRSIVRDIVALLEAEGIYGGNRTEMQNQITEILTTEFDEQGLTLTSALVRDVTFSDAFINAIEAKQVEEQQLARAETEAQRVRTEARGRADATVEEARGEAQAIRIRAEAEAEALRLVSEQIAANPNLIQFTYVQNLSDNIDLALVPAGSPFLFDFNDFTDIEEGFTAPPAVPSSSDSTDSNSDEGNDNSGGE